MNYKQANEVLNAWHDKLRTRGVRAYLDELILELQAALKQAGMAFGSSELTDDQAELLVKLEGILFGIGILGDSLALT